jgi:hypothetical protein
MVVMAELVVKRKRIHRAHRLMTRMLVRTRSHTAHQRQGNGGKKDANDRKEEFCSHTGRM